MTLNISRAIESNDIDRVKAEIAKGIKFTKVNSPLGLAASIGNLEIVKLLLDAGCKVEWGGALEPSPLFLAVHAGNSEVVKLLIEQEAKLNYKDEDGFTPLITAAAIGNFAVVKLLVTAGAKINIESEHGDFALLNALDGGHSEIYEYLLPLTSPRLVKKIENLTDSLENNIVHTKPSKDFTKLIDAIAKVAFTNAPNNSSEMNRVFKLLSKEIDPQFVDLHGLTALHHATFSPEIVTKLLGCGFKNVIDNEDNKGNTPLIDACIYDRAKVVELLLNAGADTEIKNHLGDTALIATVQFSRSNQIIKLLHNAGANLEAKDNFGNTSIDIAYTQSKSNHFPEESKSNVDLLESLGASTERLKEIDFINHSGSGNNESVIKFIEEGGNINCLGMGGISALKVAAAANHLDTLSILLDRGASIKNIADTFVSAVYTGNIEIVRELINAGVDVNEPDPNNGVFALTRAIEKNNVTMVDILLKAGAGVPKKDPVFGDVAKMAKIVNTEIYKLIVR